MSGVLLTSVIVVANVTGAGMIVPQVRRLHRHRRVDGISPTWVGVGFALNGWWLGYAIGGELWAIAPVAVLGVVLYSVIALQYRRIVCTSPLRSMAIGALGASVAPAVGLTAAGWALTGVVLGISYSFQFGPAVWAVVRADDVSGVAAGTWILAWVEAIAWLAYGVAILDPALLIGGAGGMVMSSVILVRLGRGRVEVHPTPLLRFSR